MRYLFGFICVLALGLMFACGDEGEPGGTLPNEPGPSKNLSWFTSSCDELGGATTASGACYIRCNSDSDCPTDQLECPSQGWTYQNCVVTDLFAASRGCGPEGWYNQLAGTGLYHCFMECSSEGANSECPSGWTCFDDSINPGRAFCSGYTGGTSDACRECLSICRGLPNCCQGRGCLCESECF
jgi:hypothetical protein